MLESVLRHLKNWFLVPGGIHTGTFVVEGGSIALPFLSEGQYYRIIGSVLNDGLHKYGEEAFQNVQFSGRPLKTETFCGTVWALAVPNAVETLAAEINEWNEKNGAAAQGPYQSESFGGYTYTIATDAQSGGALTWESVFRSRLNPFRKVREI